MLITIELTPGAEGWNLTITRPGREWSCDDVSGRRAVQAVTAEVEAAIDRVTVAERNRKHTHNCGRTGPRTSSVASCALDCGCWCHQTNRGSQQHQSDAQFAKEQR